MKPCNFPTRLSRRALLSAMVLLSALAASGPGSAFAQTDQLPSWNNGQARTSITDFVDRVTRVGGPDFVAPAERIAVFDNDGTLWVEQPMYVQLAFILDRV